MSHMGCKQKQVAASGADDRPRALYVHVPFCQAKCRYCDFYSLPVEPARADRFVAAMARELAGRGPVLAPPADSVFVGGGTPSCLPVDALERLLRAVRPWVGTETEFSAEANPASLTGERIDRLLAGGVNRINVGVQSLADGELEALGRLHRAPQALSAVRALRERGLANVGVDLIYGIPGQSLDSWRSSLERVLALEPDHLSCYALSFEPGTPLAGDLRTGRVRAVDDQLQRDMHEQAIALAGQAGLEHYEISNFARPSRRCAHNLVYWRNEAYLGIGPGAVSYVDGVRIANRPDLEGYLSAVEAGRPIPADRERVTGRLKQAETLMLLLRLREGVDRRAFAARFGADPVEAFARPIQRFVAMGAMEMDEQRIRISRSHLMVSDAVLAEMIAEAGEESAGGGAG
jgi:oxygen-independent coproporphyrinogen-3 oxidase